MTAGAASGPEGASPDIKTVSGTFGHWRYAAASVQGAAHQACGLPNQDCFILGHLPEGELVAAIADGAGSARHAKRGAELTVEAAYLALAIAGPDPRATVRAVLDQLIEDDITEAAEEAEKGGKETATGRGTPSDYHATLVATHLRPSGLVTAVGCGDGLLIAAQEGGYVLPMPRMSGEYAGETVFPAVTPPEQYALTTVESDFLLLSSDGLAPLLLKGQEPHAPALDPLRAWLRQDEAGNIEDALRRLMTAAQQTGRADDDLTLILLARQP